MNFNDMIRTNTLATFNRIIRNTLLSPDLTLRGIDILAYDFKLLLSTHLLNVYAGTISKMSSLFLKDEF